MRALQSVGLACYSGPDPRHLPANLPAAGTAHAADTEAREPVRPATASTISTSSSEAGAPTSTPAAPAGRVRQLVELEGSSVVHKLWDGRANLGELEVGGASSHLEGLSLRLYNPESRQWSIYWANSKDGTLVQP